jgi:hypothetical protein
MQGDLEYFVQPFWVISGVRLSAIYPTLDRLSGKTILFPSPPHLQ